MWDQVASETFNGRPVLNQGLPFEAFQTIFDPGSVLFMKTRESAFEILIHI